MYLASNNRKVEENLIQYILQFLHLGFDKILWKLNLSDILQKSPRCRRVCSLEGKYSHFLLFLTSNRFGNFGLFNVDLLGLGQIIGKKSHYQQFFIGAFPKISFVIGIISFEIHFSFLLRQTIKTIKKEINTSFFAVYL